MKRFIVWVLVLQFATGHNLLAEVLRLPILMDHYQLHRRETPDLTVVQFLRLHYSNQQHERSDSRHTQLPLHCGHVLMAETTLPHPPQIESHVFALLQTGSKDIVVADEFLRLAAPLSGVFRPPIA